jgi:hypothetical protein
VPNKIAGELREMILGALGDAGGRQYLREQATKNPTAFMTLLGKVLPTTLAGSVEVKRDVRELTDAELDAIIGSAGEAGPAAGEDEPPSVH